MKIGKDCPKDQVRIPDWERGISWKLWAGNRYTNELSKILEEFPAVEKRNIRENSCLRTGTLTDSKGFCEHSGLEKGIYGKVPGFIRKTYFRLGRESVAFRLGARIRTGTFFTV